MSNDWNVLVASFSVLLIYLTSSSEIQGLKAIFVRDCDGCPKRPQSNSHGV